MSLDKKSLNDSFVPVFLEDEMSVKALLAKLPHTVLVDAFSRQLKELFIIENPIYAGERKEEGFQTEKYREFLKQHENNFRAWSV